MTSFFRWTFRAILLLIVGIAMWKAQNAISDKRPVRSSDLYAEQFEPLDPSSDEPQPMPPKQRRIAQAFIDEPIDDILESDNSTTPVTLTSQVIGWSFH